MSMSSRLAATFALLAMTACSTLPPASPELFNGRDTAGWEFVTVPAAPIEQAVQIQSSGVIALSGQPTGYIATTANYTDYRLHFEWRWSGKPGNGGALLHIASGPKDRAWPLSIQVQTKNGNAGDVLPMAGASFAEPLTSAPTGPTPIKAHMAADNEKPVGEWNVCDVVSRAGTIEVTINGVLQNRVTQAQPPTGKVGFQFEGTPYELRAVRLTPL